MAADVLGCGETNSVSGNGEVPDVLGFEISETKVGEKLVVEISSSIIFSSILSKNSLVAYHYNMYKLKINHIPKFIKIYLYLLHQLGSIRNFLKVHLTHFH